ncbi:putative zinc-binding protein [Methanohalobium sp.]|uniref:putative zinc-binding protein n=1 Tax=Methanohalobium sp. TaxID=2837493 RepID=UPI0025CFA1D8|nr:putative zinc-binding protein [Methanohalobium sp.]
MEEDRCLCESSNAGVFPCSGGSNVGQISNKIAVELTKQDVGKMMCTVGIGGRISGLMKSAEGCDSVVAIDGCPLHCSKQTLELAGIDVSHHIVITDYGVKKDKNLEPNDSVVSECMDKVKRDLQQ